MRSNTGKWNDALFEQVRGRRAQVLSTVQINESEAAIAVTLEAQKWISRFTVAIGTLGASQNSKDIEEISPGCGVIVQLNNNIYAVLTAAHVLRRGKNTTDNVEVTLIIPPRERNVEENTFFINLQSRPCTIDGFYNETEEGPDIAMIPLLDWEWKVLDAQGMVAYNLDKKRWSDIDRIAISGMNIRTISVIHGARCMESKVIHDRIEHELGTLVMMTTATQVDVVRKRDGYDYLELPSNTSKFSLPTHWEMDLPRTVVEEIDQLQKEGVTRRVWGGTSGGGVWNLVIGTDQTGMPTGDVWAELAGICFFANFNQDCIIAHGVESIRAIANCHIEKEVFRYCTNLGGTT